MYSILIILFKTFIVMIASDIIVWGKRASWFWVEDETLNGSLKVNRRVVIIYTTPNKSVFSITNKTCSPIFVDFSYTGRVRASILSSAVRASKKVIDFRSMCGTCVPRVSWSSYEGIYLIMLCFCFNFYVIVLEIRRSTMHSFIAWHS